MRCPRAAKPAAPGPASKPAPGPAPAERAAAARGRHPLPHPLPANLARSAQRGPEPIGSASDLPPDARRPPRFEALRRAIGSGVRGRAPARGPPLQLPRGGALTRRRRDSIPEAADRMALVPRAVRSGCTRGARELDLSKPSRHRALPRNSTACSASTAFSLQPRRTPPTRARGLPAARECTTYHQACRLRALGLGKLRRWPRS